VNAPARQWVSGEGQRMIHYIDPQLQRRAVKLMPADYYIGDDEVAIVTVLGSCVAACMRDPVLGIGGMNHFMLPDGDADGGSGARYGSYAMELLINGLLKRGARRERLEAKVFGGGNVLQGFTSNPVGTRNSEFVLAYLEAERIPVLAQDLQGIHPRKVCYFPASGSALVKRLPHAHDEALVKEESLYKRSLTKAPPRGGVELFD
jgi:chemotaxis protein CheD